MAEITAALVKELREKTGAGMMDCKKALAESRRRHRGGHRLAAQEGPRGGRQEGRPRRRRGPGRRRRRRHTAAPWSRSTPRPTSSPATSTFQELRRRDRRRSRSTAAATSRRCKAAVSRHRPRPSPSELTQLIATIGENMTLRRAAHARGRRRRRRRLRAQRAGAGPRQDRRAGGARSRPATSAKLADARQADRHARRRHQPAVARPSTPSTRPRVERERAVLRRAGRGLAASPRTSSRRWSRAACASSTRKSVLLEQVFVIDGETKVVEGRRGRRQGGRRADRGHRLRRASRSARASRRKSERLRRRGGRPAQG